MATKTKNGIEEMWLQVLGKIDPPPKSLLDVGCRDLRSSLHIAEKLRDGFYGVDVDRDAVRAGRAAATGLDCHLEAVEEADFGRIFGRSFNLVMVSCVLYHLDDGLARAFFEALPSLLAPNGVCLATINTSSPPQRWREFPFVRRPVSFYRSLAANVGMGLRDLGPICNLGYQLKRATAMNKLIEVRR